jgi:hypothetical protein
MHLKVRKIYFVLSTPPPPAPPVTNHTNDYTKFINLKCSYISCVKFPKCNSTWFNEISQCRTVSVTVLKIHNSLQQRLTALGPNSGFISFTWCRKQRLFAYAEFLDQPFVTENRRVFVRGKKLVLSIFWAELRLRAEHPEEWTLQSLQIKSTLKGA